MDTPRILSHPLWPFTVEVDGEDLVVRDIVITCFGGANDPQDSGETASGYSTRRHPRALACSLPMDGLQYHGLNAREHAALDHSPIPRLPWGMTLKDGVWVSNGEACEVWVTIGDATKHLTEGVIDLGPGRQASKPGEPHALDLTESAARLFQPGIQNPSRTFEARGSFRIVNGAQFIPKLPPL
jgi:hypothetical protein